MQITLLFIKDFPVVYALSSFNKESINICLLKNANF